MPDDIELSDLSERKPHDEEPIRIVSCNDGYIMYSSQAAYGLGTNHDGELGPGLRKMYIETPVRIPLPEDAEIQDVVRATRREPSAMSEATYFITNKGLYVSGSNHNFKLGRINPDEHHKWTAEQSPVRVDLPEGIVITQCVPYEDSVYLISDHGLYVWGNNESNQLGLPDEMHVKVPTKLELPDPEAEIKAIHVRKDSPSFGVIIETNKGLYACGVNRDGTLGLVDNSGQSIVRINTPTAIPLPPDAGDIEQVVLKYNRLYVVTSNGKLYGTGVGAGIPTDTNTLTQIQLPEGHHTIQKIFSFESDFYQVRDENGQLQFTHDRELFVITDQGLLSCGSNNRGQLGQGNNTNTQTLQPVALPSEATPIHDVIRHRQLTFIHAGDELYVTGGKDSQGNPRTTPRPIALPPNAKVKRFILHKSERYKPELDWYIVETDQGYFGWGSNASGQLGLGETNESIGFPTMLTAPEGAHVDGIFSDERGTMLITGRGLYAAGENKTGELGVSTTDQTSTFSAVALPENAGAIQRIVASDPDREVYHDEKYSTLVQTQEGIYFAGNVSPDGPKQTTFGCTLLTEELQPQASKALEQALTQECGTIEQPEFEALRAQLQGVIDNAYQGIETAHRLDAAMQARAEISLARSLQPILLSWVSAVKKNDENSANALGNYFQESLSQVINQHNPQASQASSWSLSIFSSQPPSPFQGLQAAAEACAQASGPAPKG